MKLGNKQ